MGRRYIFHIPSQCGDVADLDCFSYGAEQARYQEFVIDLTSVGFIRPAGVIGMLTLLERLNSERKLVKILLPQSDEVCAYLSKIRLLDALRMITSIKGSKGVIEKVLPRVTPFVPVSGFTTSQEVDAIAIKIEESMQSESGLAPLLGTCYTIATELANNVIEHSGGARGWILAQRYKSPTGAIIEMAVGDAGMGLRASLAQNRRWAGRIMSDRDAMRLVGKPGVSRYSDIHRGYGLDFVCQEIRAKERRLIMRSGTGCLVVYDSGIRRTFERSPIIGVLATARVPC